MREDGKTMVMAVERQGLNSTDESLETMKDDPGKILVDVAIARSWAYNQQVYEEAKEVWTDNKDLMREFITTMQEQCARSVGAKVFGIRRLAEMCKRLHQDKKLKELWVIERDGPTISPTTLGSVNCGKIFPSFPVMQFIAGLYVVGENNEFLWEPWSPQEFLLYIKGEVDIKKRPIGDEAAIASRTNTLDYLKVIREAGLPEAVGIMMNSLEILGSRIRESIDRQKKAEELLSLTQLRWKAAEHELLLAKHGVQSHDDIDLFRLNKPQRQYLKSLFQIAMSEGLTEEQLWRKAGLSPQLGLATGDRCSISFDALFAIAPCLGVSSPRLINELTTLNELESSDKPKQGAENYPSRNNG
jgi:hypothetical protein